MRWLYTYIVLYGMVMDIYRIICDGYNYISYYIYGYKHIYYYMDCHNHLAYYLNGYRHISYYVVVHR